LSAVLLITLELSSVSTRNHAINNGNQKGRSLDEFKSEQSISTTVTNTIGPSRTDDFNNENRFVLTTAEPITTPSTHLRNMNSEVLNQKNSKKSLKDLIVENN
jgi:hypothetical protein